MTLPVLTGILIPQYCKRTAGKALTSFNPHRAIAFHQNGSKLHPPRTHEEFGQTLGTSGNSIKCVSVEHFRIIKTNITNKQV